MKKFAIISLVPLISFGCISCFAQSSGTAANGKKVLVAYFSWSGNTKIVAQDIQKEVGGALFEIKTVKAYPKDYNACIDYAKQEKEDNARPKLSKQVNDINSYDIIFVGYPNWWGTIPMPLFTFLESYNLEGKTIIPFCTHGSGGAGRSFDDIKKLCPKSKIINGLAINGSKVESSQKNIQDWLKKEGILKQVNLQ
jgi:flavodoxin